MENTVLISHGSMAEDVKINLEMIVGRQEHVHTVSLRPDGDNLQSKKELDERMKALNGTILIIAGLLGGTSCNVATKNYLNVDGVEIIAGMAPSAVIEAVVNQQTSIKELVCLVQENTADIKVGMSQAE